MKGQLELITGPMYSGKTSKLISRARRHNRHGFCVSAFKPAADTRDDPITSHDGEVLEAERVEDSKELVGKLEADCEVCVVDEANLFDEALVQRLQMLAYDGVRVVAAGTDKDFRGLPFAHMSSLMAVSDRLDKRQAVCQQCGARASMNQRLTEDGKPAFADEEVVKVGGKETYEARCRECHEVRTR